MLLKETVVLKVSPDLSGEKDIESLQFAADIIKKGGLVAFPTETVYGLGANALDEKAVASIFTAKGRPQDNPLIVHVESAERISDYALTYDNKFFETLKDEMPAPLTVILPKRDIIPLCVTAGRKDVGMRVPLSKVARKLIELSGVPIAAPSANLSGKPSPTKASHVIEDMTGRADVIIDGGNSRVGLESTVLTLCKDTPEILRPGGFTKEMLERLIGKVNVADAVLEALKEGDEVASPGMKYKHYAPKCKVVLVRGQKDKISALLAQKLQNEKCAVICCDGQVDVKSQNVIFMGDEKSLETYAERLFDALRQTDTLLGIDTVYAVLPKDTDGICLAIYNRMLRAAAFNIIEA